MKKKLMIALVAFVVSAAAVITLCSFTSHNEISAETQTHVSMNGDHCTGTVGCDCSGFSPITNGQEWQKSYCKRCGHHRSCHR